MNVRIIIQGTQRSVAAGNKYFILAEIATG